MEPDFKYQQVLWSFELLSEIEDECLREYELVKSARENKLPIGSFRKMYKSWTQSNR